MSKNRSGARRKVRQKKCKPTPECIKGLSIAGGVLDEVDDATINKLNDQVSVYATDLATKEFEPKIKVISDTIIEGRVDSLGIMQIMPSTFANYKDDKRKPDPIDDIRDMVDQVRKDYGSFPIDREAVYKNSVGSLMEQMLKAQRLGGAMILPNDRHSFFEWHEPETTPLPDDGLPRPEMK